MNQALRKTGILACTFLFSLSPADLLGNRAAAGMDLSDAELFSPEFFPALSDTSEGELVLAGLQSLFPAKIVTDPPQLEFPEPAAPLVREIESGGVYIRVQHLPSALPVIREHLSRPLVVLDLRFLTADLDSTLVLGSYLTRNAKLTLAKVGEYPVPTELLSGTSISIDGQNLRGANQAVFTLSNHETKGPLEALLAQLKNDEEIIAVGAASPGETAVFKPFPGIDSYQIINGEIRATTGGSLVGLGFTPRVQIAVSPTDDRLGYQSLREGVSLDALVQARASKPRFDEARLLREHSAAPGVTGEETDDENEPEVPQDPILRGALNIVKALQALGRIGS